MRFSHLNSLTPSNIQTHFRDFTFELISRWWTSRHSAWWWHHKIFWLVIAFCRSNFLKCLRNCSHKITTILHEKGHLRWDQKAKDGSTPMTLAAESECLPMLSYWKAQKADFNAKDGRGLSALSILRKKNGSIPTY